jgi:hypothetical protein
VERTTWVDNENVISNTLKKWESSRMQLAKFGSGGTAKFENYHFLFQLSNGLLLVYREVKAITRVDGGMGWDAAS